MRAMTIRQSLRCEHAKSARCRCRCRGLAHGRQKHFAFNDLPASDPHAIALRRNVEPRGTRAGAVGLTDRHPATDTARGSALEFLPDAGQDQIGLSGE